MVSYRDKSDRYLEKSVAAGAHQALKYSIQSQARKVNVSADLCRRVRLLFGFLADRRASRAAPG